MSSSLSQPRMLEIVEALLDNSTSESEVVEYKSNHLSPEKLGKYVSSLANSAAIKGKRYAYLLFGVDDESKAAIGTTFDPESLTVGNQALLPWLHSMLGGNAHFEFSALEVQNKRLVLGIIHAAEGHPVSFQNASWCRVGSHNKKLADHPELERELWRSFDKTPFELRAASAAIDEEEVLELLSVQTYFDLVDIVPLATTEEVIEELRKAGMVVPAEVVGWHVTNMGALFLAKEIAEFPQVARKAVRLLRYYGDSKSAEAEEIEGVKGYAVGFSGLVSTARRKLPSSETFEGGIRRLVPKVSERALRELISNALIHQDLLATGGGPTIEIFDDRVEICNPGESLIPKDRIIGGLQKSRNEKFAMAARRMGICDERGSGWDLVGDFIDGGGLPAPLIESQGGFMRVTIWWKRDIADYSREELLDAIFFHALVQDAKKSRVTNASVKKRFGFPEKDGGKTSKLLRQAVDDGYLKIYDIEAGPKSRSYVPYFAAAK